jgi:hypothetical protein
VDGRPLLASGAAQVCAGPRGGSLPSRKFILERDDLGRQRAQAQQAARRSTDRRLAGRPADELARRRVHAGRNDVMEGSSCLLEPEPGWTGSHLEQQPTTRRGQAGDGQRTLVKLSGPVSTGRRDVPPCGGQASPGPSLSDRQAMDLAVGGAHGGLLGELTCARGGDA